MDTQLFRDIDTVDVDEGDILIKYGAGFKDIMDILVEHARLYLPGEYTREVIMKEMMR